MANIKDHPKHIQEDHFYGNPDGTEGQFSHINEFDGQIPAGPGAAVDRYGLVQIIAKYNRYADTDGTGGSGQITKSGAANWGTNVWVDWFVQDKDGVKYRIVSNNEDTLFVGGPYDLPSGAFYIIRDRDFSGFEVFECKINETTSEWEILNEQPIFDKFNRREYATEGGTLITYYIYKELNDYYYFQVNTIDTQGNKSINSIKNRVRVWVGKGVGPADEVPDVSLRGKFDSSGIGWIKDSTKDWETGDFGTFDEFGEHFVNIADNIYGRKRRTYKINYNITNTLYLKWGGTPALGQYAIFLDTSTEEDGDGLPQRIKGRGGPDEPDASQAFSGQSSWFTGGVIK